MTAFQQERTVRVEQAAAGYTAQTGPRHKGVAVSEHMSFDVLLLTPPAALLADELPVEDFERPTLRLELVRVAFDSFGCDLGVQLDEGGHDVVLALVV